MHSSFIWLQARACGGYPEPKLQELLAEQCHSTIQQRHEGGQELLATTKAVLNKQGSSWRAACTVLGQLLTQLSQSHDKHAEGHALLKQGIKRALEVTKEVGARSPSSCGRQAFISIGSSHGALCVWSTVAGSTPCDSVDSISQDA